MTHRLLALYALLATGAAVACGVGWWRAVENASPANHESRTRASRPAHGSSTLGSQTLPAAPEPATAQNSGFAPTIPKATAETPSPPESEGGVSPSPRLADPAPPIGEAAPWPPKRLADVPGNSPREKIQNLLKQLGAALGELGPNEGSKRLKLRQEASQLIGDAEKLDRPEMTQAILDLYRVEQDSEMSEVLAWRLQFHHPSLPGGPKIQAWILELSASGDAEERKKAFRIAGYKPTQEVIDRWSRAVRTAAREDVRAVAA